MSQRHRCVEVSSIPHNWRMYAVLKKKNYYATGNFPLLLIFTHLYDINKCLKEINK